MMPLTLRVVNLAIAFSKRRFHSVCLIASLELEYFKCLNSRQLISMEKNLHVFD